MTQRSDTYDESAPAVDYELQSDDTGRTIKIPQRPVPAGWVALPRWCFVALLGLSLVGAVFSVLLVAAVLAAQ